MSVISSITRDETKPTGEPPVQIGDILRNNVKEKLARDEVVASCRRSGMMRKRPVA